MESYTNDGSVGTEPETSVNPRTPTVGTQLSELGLRDLARVDSQMSDGIILMGVLIITYSFDMCRRDLAQLKNIQKLKFPTEFLQNFNRGMLRCLPAGPWC